MIKNNNKSVKIPCKNLAIANIDGDFKFCIVKLDKETGNVLSVYVLDSCKEIDKERVTKIKDMFVLFDVYEEGCGKLVNIMENFKCPAWKNIRSKKTSDAIFRIAPYSNEVKWLNEGEGVCTVNEDNLKEVPLKKLLKLEEKINKIEKKLLREEIVRV